MLKKLVCVFTDGKVMKTMVFKAITQMRCLSMASAWQVKHNAACLSMKFA